MIDSRLKNGAILWKGKSPVTERHLVVRYDQSKDGPTDAAICPKELVGPARALGFNVKPHWDETQAKKGHKVISHSRINIVEERELGEYQIDPLVFAFMSGDKIKNQNVVHMLRRGDES